MKPICIFKIFTRPLFFIFLILFGKICYSQQVTWGFNIGGSAVDYSQGSHVDANGNVYLCGEFRGSNVDFDPSPANSLFNSNGLSDGFFAKYSSNGQYIFCQTIGGSNLDKINSITTDQAGNIYITGFFRGSNVDFDPSPATYFLTSNGEGGGDPGYGGDIFIAKYSSIGQFQWAFNIGGTSLGDNGLSIEADASGNIFVGGYFRESIDFNPASNVNILTASTGTAFLGKYNSSGQYQWAINFGAPNIDNVVFDIRLDLMNNVFITGYFQGTNIDFDPSPGTALLSASGNFEAYIAKYTSSGQYQFAFKIGGTGLDTGRGLVLDNLGNIYVLGDFNGTNVDFDPSPATANLSSNGASDIFVAKYTNTGQYVWAFNAGSGGGEIGWKIDTDNINVFVTGGFSGTADFNPSAAVDNLTSNGASDIFLAKYSIAGVYQCAFNIGSSGNDNGFDIIIAGIDLFYLSGSFQGNGIDFTPTQSTFLLNSNGNDDAFLIKYNWPDNTQPEGVIQGNVICKGGIGKLTFTASSGTSPFTIQYTDGTNSYTQANVISGVPFNLQ
ncbi:MAG: SBBP repeat-containing protein, partial [Chitinophagaceae bacterium]